jgi:hypothetical protein
MLDDSVSGDLRHVLVRLVHALSTPIAQREDYRLGQVARVGRREVVVGGIGLTLLVITGEERSKNDVQRLRKQRLLQRISDRVQPNAHSGEMARGRAEPGAARRHLADRPGPCYSSP